MEQFKTIQAAWKWLADQIRLKGNYQWPVNTQNRLNNWSAVDEWIWGVFKFQVMDAGYYMKVRHSVDGWEVAETRTNKGTAYTADGISEEDFMAIASLLKDATDNAG